MLEGELPYVNMWDRKPFGLFLIYAAIAALSASVVSYQIVATIFVGVTAFLLTRLVAGRVSLVAQVAVAFLYVALLPWLGGFGGQTPVFYNAIMLAAVLLVVRSLPELQSGKLGPRVYGAITLCGVALTVKQTVVVESAFLGLFALRVAYNNGLPLRLAVIHLAAFVVIGLLPFALCGVFYVLLGNWAEFYQAMIGSNLQKGNLSGGRRVMEARLLVFPLAFPLALSSAALATMAAGPLRTFLFGWLVAAIAALFLVPNFYWHYGLPLLLPLCVCAAFAFHRWPILIPITVAVGLLGLNFTKAFDLQFHRRSAIQFEYLKRQAAAHSPRGTLLVYDGPVYLYAATGKRPLSKVFFPNHFSEIIENRTTGRSSETELKRVLNAYPSAVVFEPGDGFLGDNPVTRQMVQRYVDANCRFISRHLSFESGIPWLTNLYGDCQTPNVASPEPLND